MLCPKTRERLAKVEALLRRPGTDGERKAAAEARERIYRSAGLAVPPLPEEPRIAASHTMSASEFDEALRRTAQRHAAEHAERRRREAAARAQAAEELRAHEAAARAKAEADAAFLRRAGCKRLEALLRAYGAASGSFLASRLGQREHSVRALISRMRRAGAPIKMVAGLYTWAGR